MLFQVDITTPYTACALARNAYSAKTRSVPAYRPLAERFWEKVYKTPTCWIWTASRDRGGYGEIGLERGTNRIGKAHRVSWELHFGVIPDGGRVLHKCDTPPCVRPSHLFLGDQADNMADCRAKDRHTRGERNARTPFSEFNIRQMHAAVVGGESRKAVAQRYGLSGSALSKILLGKNWGHLKLAPIRIRRLRQSPINKHNHSDILSTKST